ncbi:MAG TPA: hypothetical protein VE402_02815, partial [Candidatus Angelobacter sp.]|nr:hypothetical protein [Candidatus Angelobacter sp.]
MPEGWSVSLKPRGAARFFTAAFLLFWLCGWAVGEGLALWLLGKGAVALMMGEPPGPGHAPLQIGPAVAIGAFLLVWLFFWTLGGIAAMSELMRMVWSEDRLIVHGAGLAVVRSRGPFHWRRELPRDELRRIILVPRNDALAAETMRERVELSRNGTRAEREEAAAALRSQLGLSEAGLESRIELPKGWEEIITPEGDRAVVPDVSTRRVHARIASIFTFGIATVAILLIREALRFAALLPIAIIAALAAMGLTWGTAWLVRGRMEWRGGGGRLILRRRFGSGARDVFEAQRLELVVTTDSDGDERFALEAVQGSADLPAPQPLSRASRKNRRVVASALHDPTVPRLLGAWLARAANVPIQDRTSREAREAEMVQLRKQLDQSGPLGRAASCLLAAAV